MALYRDGHFTLVKDKILNPATISPGRHLISHHDFVISVGHQQPEGLLEGILDEVVLLPLRRHFRQQLASVRASLASRLDFCLHFGVMLQRVDAAKIFAGVAAPCTDFKIKQEKITF